MRDILKRRNTNIFISFLTLIIFAALFTLRSIDDNRLTSWEWVFKAIDVTWIYITVLLGIAAAALLSRVSLMERYPAVFLFSLSFLMSALFWKESEVIVDASRYFTQAKHLETYGIKYFANEWGGTIQAWTDMPLVPFFYGLIFKLFGETRLFIQIFTTALFSLTVIITYAIGKTLWDEDTGFYGGFLLLGIPYLYTQIPLMLVDVPAMFALTLAVFTFIKALSRGGVWIIFSSVSIFFAFFSKYSIWPMLSILIVIFIACFISKKYRLSVVSRRLLSLQNADCQVPDYTSRGITVTLFTGLLIGTVFWYKFDFFVEQINFLFSYQRPGLRRWSESFISTFFFQVHPFITVAAVCSVYAALKKRDLTFIIIAWLLVLVILLQIRRIRYIIPVFPMLTLMASYGLSIIRDKAVVRFISLCAVTSSLAIGLFAYLPFLQGMSASNLKSAGQFLDSIANAEVRIFTVPSANRDVNPAVAVPLLDLFTHKILGYDYIADSVPQREEVEESPLRFTWEYRNPAYYSDTQYSRETFAVVVISDSADVILPEHIKRRITGYRLSKVFTVYEGVFLYRTSVSIYEWQAKI